MIGFTELILILVLSASLYFLLKPPVWYNKSKRRAFISQYGGIAKQQKLQDLVTSIGLNIARAANYSAEALEFQILRSPIPNAFAWDSKTVFLTMGLFDLTESRDELAAVLAHEIGHLAAGHPKARTMNRAKTILLSSAFSGMGWVMSRVGFLSPTPKRLPIRENRSVKLTVCQSPIYDMEVMTLVPQSECWRSYTDSARLLENPRTPCKNYCRHTQSIMNESP